MNNRPIEQSLDTDLRLSIVALRRAAVRAREIAQRKGTDLIVVEHGQLRRITPMQQPAITQLDTTDKR